MRKTEKKSQKGLTGLLVVTFIFFILFAIAFVLFGVFAAQTSDADFGSFGDVMLYHLGGIGALFTFKFNDASNVIYTALSIVLYVLIVLWVIFFIQAIIIEEKVKKVTLL